MNTVEAKQTIELTPEIMARANKMHMALSAFAFDFWPQKNNGAREGL